MRFSGFPDNTAITLRMDRLIRASEQQRLSERMSSRMIKCASVLESGGFLGWQMQIPVRGRVIMELFGSEDLSRDDLAWVIEKTGSPSVRACAGKTDRSLSELYELRLPAAEGGGENAIGFGNRGSRRPGGELDGWPEYFTAQFSELVNVFRISGAALRCVVGPADEAEQLACRKNTLRTCSAGSIPAEEYIGRPVKVRVLLRLPAAPSVRLRTVVEGAVRGAKLRFLGSMHGAAASIWDSPLGGAGVLPDFAARIMMLEPEGREAIPGIGICEERMKSIPAAHRNTKDPKAVEIGRAVDTSGSHRRITIGELDLKRHYQIVGQTGTGKSTLLASLILNAIGKGHGLTFFDPHGSTIDVVLRALPEQYAHRVRVVRIGDAEHPVPLGLWDSDDLVKEERNINDLCELFGDIFNPPNESYVGPRYERWLSTFAKASIAFLGRRASLESIAVISQSQDNMLKVSKAIIDRYPELVETIRQEYGLDKSSDFHATLSWYLCKFQRLTSVEQLRRTLGAGTNALDFPHTIDTDTVTLIDLASPIIGTHASRIAGTLLLMKLWNAALERKERERTHLVVVDEASLFQTNPMPRMLAESRKFGISMVLCHQHEGQLPAVIRDALEANSANFSAFRLSPRDAVAAAVRFDDPVMQTSLTRLDAFRAVTTLSVDGRQTMPFTLEIQQPRRQKDGEKIAEEIERRSIETLVEPYRDQRALTSSEILDLLENPEKRARKLRRAVPQAPRAAAPGSTEPPERHERRIRRQGSQKSA